MKITSSHPYEAACLFAAVFLYGSVLLFATYYVISPSLYGTAETQCEAPMADPVLPNIHQ